MKISIQAKKSEKEVADKISEKLDVILEDMLDELAESDFEGLDENFEPSEEEIEDIFDKISEELSKKELKPYQKRLQREYHETKERYDRLHKILIKSEAGTLEFDLNCPLGLLEEQAHHMGIYLKCLEIRAEIEGVPLD